MLIDRHHHMECFFNLSDRAIEIDNQAIRGCAGYGESVRLGETDDRLVILRARSELFGELRHAEKLSIVRTGWIVYTTEEAGEFGLIADGKNHRQLQALILRKQADRRSLMTGDNRTDVIV